MPVLSPPPPSTIDPDRDLDQRVSDLEALIEEARRRTRRRRQRNLAVVLLVAAGGVAASIGFGGHGGGAGSVATALARNSSAVAAHGSSLGALPPDAGWVESFAFDPDNPQVVYVLTTVYVAGRDDVEGRLYKTTDGGTTWRATAAGGRGWIGDYEALAADPRHPRTLYVGTEKAVYKTRDGGKTWRRSTRGLFAPSGSAYDFNKDRGWVTALTIDPSNPKIVYAGSDRISKSSDGGQSWKTVFPPHPVRYPLDKVSALAIAHTNPETIYAIVGEFANPGMTPADGPTSIYKSIDGGKTWQLSLAVHGDVVPTALAVDPRHPSTVYAAVSAKLVKTTDAGKTWQPIAAGLPISATRGACHCLSNRGVRALAVDPRRYGTVYAALTEGGIYKTTNGGHTWARAWGGTSWSMYTVAVDPARPATVFGTGLSETGSGARRFLRSTDSGRTWATAP
jgi:photosystem II stability/assembly factor-like uncharacterized protein